MKKIGQGRRGEVYVYEKDGKIIARKIALDKSKKASITKEFQILIKLNKNNIKFVPKIMGKGEDFFDYEYIKGEHFNKVYKNLNPKKAKKIISSLLEKVYYLDKVGIVHGELIKPYTNILVSDNDNIYIIDFERGKFNDFTGKNLRSFSQWLKNQSYLKISDLIKIGNLKKSKDMYLYIKRKINKFSWCWILILVFLFLILDLLTKFVFYSQGVFSDFFLITPVLNKGISWGISFELFYIYIVTFFSLFLFFFIYYKNWISSWIFILFISGALGNLIDRIYLGGVRDFISIGNFPVFNLADVYLTFAIVLLIYEEIF